MRNDGYVKNTLVNCNKNDRLPILHLSRVQLRCKFLEKWHHVTWPLWHITCVKYSCIQACIIDMFYCRVKIIHVSEVEQGTVEKNSSTIGSSSLLWPLSYRWYTAKSHQPVAMLLRKGLNDVVLPTVYTVITPGLPEQLCSMLLTTMSVVLQARNFGLCSWKIPSTEPRRVAS